MKVLSEHRPLGLVEGNVITYLDDYLYLCDSDLRPIRRLARTPRTRDRALATRFGLTRRLLRLEPTDAVALTASSALVNMGHRILHVNLSAGNAAVDFLVPIGRKAMRLRRIQGVSGFPEGIVFGDYCPNPHKQELRLWFRPLDDRGQWTPMITIPAGTANHVHDVVPDPYRGCLWVLTGDFDEAPAIWRLSPDMTLTPLFRGTQQDRAATLHATPDALFYATDTPLEKNHLYRVDLAGTGPIRSIVAELPGSVIYGEASAGDFFFSTTVEPGMPTGSRMHDWTSRRPGPGITSNRSHLYRLQPEGPLEELGSAKKDAWPMVLFQFGTFHVCPAPGGGAYAYGVALRRAGRAFRLPASAQA